jgi:hypothetical protein
MSEAAFSGQSPHEHSLQPIQESPQSTNRYAQLRELTLLQRAFAEVKTCAGDLTVDSPFISEIDPQSEQTFLAALSTDLKKRTYRPGANQSVYPEAPGDLPTECLCQG